MRRAVRWRSAGRRCRPGGGRMWRWRVRAESPPFRSTASCAPVIAEHRLPFRLFDELILGVEMDLDPHRYATYGELEQYCYRVASVVGSGQASRSSATATPPAGNMPTPWARPSSLPIFSAMSAMMRSADGSTSRTRSCGVIGVTAEEILEGRDSDRFQAVAAAFDARAREFYRKALGLPASCRAPHHGGRRTDGRRVLETASATGTAAVSSPGARTGSGRANLTNWGCCFWRGCAFEPGFLSRRMEADGIQRGWRLWMPRISDRETPMDQPPGNYQPPVWLQGAHAQTVWPSMIRNVTGIRPERSGSSFPTATSSMWTGRGVGGRRLVVVAHGLEGDSRLPATVTGLMRAI